jgi:hypothetical protein
VETVRTGRQHLPSILIIIHRRRRKFFSANRTRGIFPGPFFAFFRISFQDDESEEDKEENVSKVFRFLVLLFFFVD